MTKQTRRDIEKLIELIILALSTQVLIELLFTPFVPNMVKYIMILLYLVYPAFKLIKLIH